MKKIKRQKLGAEYVNIDGPYRARGKVIFGGESYMENSYLNPGTTGNDNRGW